MHIEGKTALVTGANRGLGKAFVEALLAAGCARVYAGMRQLEASEDPRIIPVELDVTSDASVKAAAERCTDVEILVNNAGIMRSVSILSSSAASAIREEMDVNVYGLMRTAQDFAPVLAANGGGVIANMLSVVTWFTPATVATYAASKHAALAVTESLRIELKRQSTRVIAIHAGFIDTDMTAGISVPKIAPQQVAQALIDALLQDNDTVLADDRSKQVADLTYLDRTMADASQAIWDKATA